MSDPVRKWLVPAILLVGVVIAVVSWRGSDTPSPAAGGASELTADPALEPLRRTHAANVERYARLPISPAPESVETATAAVGPLLSHALSDPADAEALREAFGRRGMPAEVRGDLARRLATAYLAAGGGLDRAEYLATLPPGFVYHVDRDSAYLLYLLDGDPPDDDADVFALLYDRHHAAANGRVTRWPTTRGGFVAAVGFVYHNDDLSPAYGEVDVGFWQGDLVQGAPVLTGPPVPFRRAADATVGRPVPYVQTMMIVGSGEDAFPIEVSCWYDDTTGRWWVEAANRRSSPAATAGPPVVF